MPIEREGALCAQSEAALGSQFTSINCTCIAGLLSEAVAGAGVVVI